MKKLAIFVEGQTERIFVERFIRLLVNETHLRVAVFQTSGGRNSPRRITIVHQDLPDPEQVYYIQIMESMNDERVGTDVRDR
jgi:hypothetical protein